MTAPAWEEHEPARHQVMLVITITGDPVYPSFEEFTWSASMSRQSSRQPSTDQHTTYTFSIVAIIYSIGVSAAMPRMPCPGLLHILIPEQWSCQSLSDFHPPRRIASGNHPGILISLGRW